MVSIVLIGCLYSCDSKNINKGDDLPKIIVGVDKYQPYTYLDLDGNFTGIDIELARIVFEKLGYTPDFEFISWHDKDTLLDNGSIDCIWSCYSMNEREERYTWAGPYLNSPQVIAVRSNSDIYTFDDLVNSRVGVQATTRAAALFLHDTDSNLPEVYQVNIFSTTDDMFAAMRKGYVDAIAGHESLINELIREGEGKYRLLSESPQVSKVGVAFKKGTHIELANQINEVFIELTDDGTITQIVEKYGLDANFSIIGGAK